MLFLYSPYAAFSPIKTLIFPTFRRILVALSVEWRISTLYFTWLPERGNEKVKYLIPPRESNPKATCQQLHICPLRHDSSSYTYVHIYFFLFRVLYLKTKKRHPYRIPISISDCSSVKTIYFDIA